MFREILDLLKDGRTRSLEDMTVELQQSPDQIKAGLEYLEHMGYIKKSALSSTCESKQCSNCHGCDYSGVENRSVFWEILL